MKVEIDLNDILGDESGVETLQDSVRRQVVDHLGMEVKKGIGKQIDSEIAKIINEELKVALKARIPALIDELMTTEYTPVDRWGDRQRDKTTTFRKELVRSINEEMVYKKTQYSSDANSFTKAVDSVIKDNVDEFKTTFNKLVNSTFTTEIMNHAMQELQKKFGIASQKA